MKCTKNCEGGALPFTADMLQKMLPLISLKEKEISQLQSNSNRFWLFKYLELQGNTHYEAVVVASRKSASVFGLFATYSTEAFLTTIGKQVDRESE